MPPEARRPSLPTIAFAWEELGHHGLREIFPGNDALAIGWGEPFCFRCGWLAPVLEAADHPPEWDFRRVISRVWGDASGWLERAHLHDRQFGGNDDPLNFAPLCVLCHLSQPACRTRAEGITFVNSPPEQHLRWLVQVITDDNRALLRPGRKRAKQRILDAHETAIEAIRNAQLESTEPNLADYARALVQILHPYIAKKPDAADQSTSGSDAS